MRNNVVCRRGGIGVYRRGLSLIEVAVATVIIGLGVVAMMASIASGTRVNASGKMLTEAVFLAQEVREWTVKLPFSDPEPAHAHNPHGPDAGDAAVDDLDDLKDVTYSPPRNGQGSPIASSQGWTEHITVTWRKADVLTAADPAETSDVAYVEVTLSHDGKAVLQTGWLVARSS